jgi:hypothetical protein
MLARDFGFSPESRTLHDLIRPLSREPRDKTLSHICRIRLLIA